MIVVKVSLLFPASSEKFLSVHLSATSTCLCVSCISSWPLYQVLQSLEYTHLSQYHAGLLHSSFAAQLEGLGLWHWAAFVLLHIQDPVR